MADNTLLNAGTGGDTLASDDIVGIKHQRVKVEFGADGSATDVSAAAPLPTEQIGATPAGANAIGRLTGTVSTANSTTTPLGIGGIFTGTFEEIKDYGAISVIVFANVASAADGLAFQWSSDGVNADRIESSSVDAATGRAFSLTPRARYFRVVYTNGGTGQATFRLGTVFHPAGSGLISRPLDQALNDENFAQTVRACLDAQDTTTDFSHIQARDAAPAGTEMGLVTRNIPSGTQPVSAASLPLPTGAATAALQLANSHDVTVDNAAGATSVPVQGAAAHDAATAGNPTLVGGQMETIADSAPGTRAGTDGDATKLAALDGALYVIPTGPQSWQTVNLGTLTGATVKGTPGAGLSLYVTWMTFSIGAATASSIKLTISAGADITGPHYLEAINGRGVHFTFPTPLKVTANTALLATSTGSATATLNVGGFTAPG